MSRTAKLLLSACFTMLCHQSSAAQFATTEERPVLAQELKTVRASGKVMTALWTRRTTSYTLQLVFPVSSGRAARTNVAVAAQNPTDARSGARVQVWLLNADGSQVSLPSQFMPANPGPPKCGPRCISYEVSFSFPLDAGKQAVAAAIQINDDFFIDQLESLGAR